MSQDVAAAKAPAPERTRRILHSPVLPTLLALAVPNLVVMLAQATANFLESYYVGLLGVDALAGAAAACPSATPSAPPAPASLAKPPPCCNAKAAATPWPLSASAVRGMPGAFLRPLGDDFGWNTEQTSSAPACASCCSD